MGCKGLAVVLLVLGVPLWADYVVQKGDSGLAISQKNRVPLEILSRANPGIEWTKLKVGAKVTIPESYVVKPGDTLYSLSRGWGLDQSAVLGFNGLSNATLRVGQVLYLPRSASGPTPPKPTPTPGPTPTPPGTTPTAKGNANPWPVDRPPLASGDKLKSVQFATLGEPFRSVSAGSVVYRGEFRGVGRVLLVQTADRIVYAYGNYESASVEFGQTVAPGQVLGTTSARPAQKLLFFAFRDSQSLDVFSTKR